MILPSLDFDIDITDDAKLRMSWSETITRPTYADLQAGYSIDQLFRIDRGTGSGGNPELCHSSLKILIFQLNIIMVT